MRYTAIPHRYYRHESGRIASIYGAAPWTRAQDAALWSVVQSGFTWADAKTGTIGLGRSPVATLQEAQAIADSLNRAWDIALQAHGKAWAPINAPVIWTKRDGKHDSGEGWQRQRHGATAQFATRARMGCSSEVFRYDRNRIAGIDRKT